MTRLLFAICALLLATTNIESQAQNLLKMLGNAIESEVKNKNKKGSDDDSNNSQQSNNDVVMTEKDIAKYNKKMRSEASKLDRSKYYTKEKADKSYPPNHPVTIDFTPEFASTLIGGLKDYCIDNYFISMGGIGNIANTKNSQLYVNRLIVNVEDNKSYKYLGDILPNIKEVWFSHKVDVATILNELVTASEEWEFSSKGGYSREMTIFIPASKYPKGLITIQEQLKSNPNWMKSIPTQVLKFRTLIYTGDVYDAVKNGANACKSFCKTHSFTAEVTAAHTYMRHASCQHNYKFYYSCKYCGEVEHNPKHTFVKDQFKKRKSDQLPHTFVKYDLSDEHFVGRNSKGEKVYRTSCYWCGVDGRGEIEHFTQTELVRDFGSDSEVSLAEFKRQKLIAWDGVYSEEALANTFVDGFQYPGHFAVPEDDHGAKTNKTTQSDTRWAMVNGLIDRKVLGNDYLQNITTRQLVSLAVRLAEQLSGKDIKSTTKGESAYISKATAAGFISETDDLNAIVSRQQMATYMYKALQWVKKNSKIRYTTYTSHLEDYKDCGQIADWAVEAMGFMNALNLVKGTTKNTLEPLKSCTIEEAVVLAQKCFYAEELGWYQCISPYEKGFSGSAMGATSTLVKQFQSQPVYDGQIIINSFDNSDRIWVSEPWIGINQFKTAQKDAFLPTIDKHTGTTIFVGGEEFLPIKD